MDSSPNAETLPTRAVTIVLNACAESSPCWPAVPDSCQCRQRTQTHFLLLGPHCAVLPAGQGLGPLRVERGDAVHLAGRANFTIFDKNQPSRSNSYQLEEREEIVAQTITYFSLTKDPSRAGEDCPSWTRLIRHFGPVTRIPVVRALMPPLSARLMHITQARVYQSTMTCRGVARWLHIQVFPLARNRTDRPCPIRFELPTRSANVLPDSTATLAPLRSMEITAVRQQATDTCPGLDGGKIGKMLPPHE